MTTDYRQTEAELVAHFTSAVGVQAQRYEADLSGKTPFDSWKAGAHLGFDRTLHQASQDMRDVDSTLATLSPADAWVLRQGYGSRQYGEGVYRIRAGAEQFDKEGKSVTHDPHKAALAQLLPFCEATRLARIAWAERQHFQTVHLDVETIAAWLDKEIHGPAFTRLLDATEAWLEGPLLAYHDARHARLALAASRRREAAKRHEAARKAHLDDLLGGLHVKLWGQ